MQRRVFAEKAVLLTGASAGIGRELARVFASEGARLALVARRRERLEILAGELERAGAVRPHVFVADLARLEECDRVAAEACGALGGIDVLVNNAGLGEAGAFLTLDPAAVQRVVDVNISALLRLTRAVVPGMVARGRGWILNLASGAGFVPMPYMQVYAASKAFVLSFSEALWYELRDRGVHVCCLCPGFTQTEFFDRGGFQAYKHRVYARAMSAAKVADLARDALARESRLRQCNPVDAWFLWLSRFVPRRWALGVTGGVIRKVLG